MATPKGLRQVTIQLDCGAKLVLYGSRGDPLLILQLRRLTPTEESMLDPSYKVAVALSPAEALAVGSELTRYAATGMPPVHIS